MLEHDGDERSDLVCSLCPSCPWSKRYWLGSRRPEWRRKKDHGLYMCIKHNLHENLHVSYGRKWQRFYADLVFFPCKIAQLETPFSTSVTITNCTSLEEMKPIVHKFFGVFTSRPKVDQLNLALNVVGKKREHYEKQKIANLSCLCIPQEICPVRVCLHGPELEEFLKTYFNYPRRNLYLISQLEWHKLNKLERLPHLGPPDLAYQRSLHQH